MAVIIPIFLMQHYSTSSQQTGSTFHYLNKTNKSLPLQLIMTTIINDPILFKLTSHFCFFFFILFVSQIYQSVLYLAIVFCAPLFIDFISILYVYMSLFKLYMCICMNRTKKIIYVNRKEPWTRLGPKVQTSTSWGLI